MRFQTSIDGIEASHLTGGFFEGWPNTPSHDAHLRILQGSAHVVVAINDESKVVGFITAISDGVSSAYIPHLEVLPQYRGQGVGKELVQRMLHQLSHLYMIDLTCDDYVVPFYESLGLRRANAMLIRNYSQQSCS